MSGIGLKQMPGHEINKTDASDERNVAAALLQRVLAK